jgi:hypothetical protein
MSPFFVSSHVQPGKGKGRERRSIRDCQAMPEELKMEA